MKRLLPIIAILILAWAGKAAGAEIVYKDGAGYKTGGFSNCEDASGWTQNDLEAACAAAGASGTLRICDGTYSANGELSANYWDIDEAGLSVIGQSEAGTIIDATGRIRGIRINGVNANLSYLTVKNSTEYGIQVVAGAQDTTVDMSHVTAQDNGLHGVYYYTISSNAFSVVGTVRYCTFTGNGLSGLQFANNDGMIVEYCTAGGNAKTPGERYGIAGEGSTGSYTSGWADQGGGVWSRAWTSTVVGVVDKTNDLVLVDGGDATPSAGQYGLVADALYINTDGNEPNGDTIKVGIKLVENAIIRYCSATDTGDEGDVEGHGFYFDGFSSACTVHNCYTEGNGNIGIGFNMAINPVVYNNVCNQDLDRGIAFLVGSYGITCVNNTVNGNDTDPDSSGIRILASNKDEITLLQNNIVANIGSHGLSAEAGVNDANHGYNLVYSCTGTAWDGLTKDANSLEADPDFTNATGGDFTPQNEDVCNGGVYVNIDTDYHGRFIPSGDYGDANEFKPQIGAIRCEKGYHDINGINSWSSKNPHAGAVVDHRKDKLID